MNYIVCNHLEADHSGSLDAIAQKCPNATIFVSQPNGLKNIAKFCGEHTYQGVKAGDSINIGKRTLKFVPVPMLHWPDSMVTYCPEAKNSFSLMMVLVNISLLMNVLMMKLIMLFLMYEDEKSTMLIF